MSRFAPVIVVTFVFPSRAGLSQETGFDRHQPPEGITYFGWYEIFSGIADTMCAPLDAAERRRPSAY